MYKDLFSLKNKHAVVLGGSGLIGQQIVRALTEFDASVHSIDKQEAKEKVPGTTFHQTDICSKDHLQSVLEDIINQRGQIHILVNCAYPRTKDWGIKFEKIPFASWNENTEYQLGSCFLSCQIAAEHMKKHQSGSIINIGSTYGMVGPDFSIYEGTEMTMPAAYSAIKGGVINFTRYLATYYGRHHIRVNCISPGGIFDHQPQEFVQKYSLKTPLGRMGKPYEIATAAVFLASDASSYVTGHNLVVDGGWTAW